MILPVQCPVEGAIDHFMGDATCLYTFFSETDDKWQAKKVRRLPRKFLF